MRYIQPYGVSDQNAPYVNGDPSRGIQGSIPPAAAFEHPMREMHSLIDKSKLTPDSADLLQVTKSVRSQRLNFVEDTGAANTLSVSYDPPLVYTLGLLIRVRVRVTNNGPATIDAGAGRVPIKRPNGGALQSNDLPAGGIADLVYDGSAFQLVSGFVAGGDTTNNYFTLPYCVDSSGTPNVITAPFSPAITVQQAGTAFLVRISNTNTGPTTISVNGLPSKSVRANVDAQNLLPGDIAAGSVVLFVFDGVNYYIDPNPLIPASCTLNVPSQFPTIQAVLTALGRKTIGYNVYCVIKLAAGIYSGNIDIYHKDGDRIIIQGTMLAAAPVLGNFFQTGSSAAARAQDAANNIIMLRSRYGTEIQVPTSPYVNHPYLPGYYGYGIRNLGPGCPSVQDILVTCGLKQAYTTGVYGTVGQPPMKTIQLVNVAIWGAYWGIWSAGQIDLRSCSVTNCYHGANIQNSGTLFTGNSFYISNDIAGINCTAHSYCDAQTCNVQSNGSYGLLSTDGSGIRFEVASASIANGVFDAYADTNSQITIGGNGSYANTYSPPPFTVGNYNAIIFTF